MSVESINSNAVPAVQQQPASQGTEKLNKTEQVNSLNVSEKSKVEQSTTTENTASREEIDAAVTKLNDFMKNSPQRNLSFSVDEDTKDLVIKVTDSVTNETIKQMPTEEALAVAKQIESMLGLILNDKA